ncbi:DNA replication protein, partial [Citrobacter werkmanii]|uniref:phage/plasmid replication protein, II/X family n=1 Tax=Citrobacter werkmanii TaxID=67827 RepID=UPI001EEDBA78
GYNNVQDTMPRNSFYRALNDLMVIGFSKAQLQQLSSDKSSVVPLFRVINIDFNNQRPSWYVEPRSHFDRVA